MTLGPTSQTPELLFGGDYNPEQWPESVWQEDVRLMRKAHVNRVTVGVFAWSSIEPREGHYTFGWLDRVLDLMAENGIGVVLATPTASPPPWFSLAHPEALPVTADGVRLIHGSRRRNSGVLAVCGDPALALLLFVSPRESSWRGTIGGSRTVVTGHRSCGG